MSETAAKPAFRRGAEAAAEASKFTQFARTEFLNLSDGESIVLRFLTEYAETYPGEEAWIVVNQHSMVPTRPQPEAYKGDKWPRAMGSVCRHDIAFKDMYGDCYICDVMIPNAPLGKDGKPTIRKPSARNWALACVREEVKATKEDVEAGRAQSVGQILGYRDATREVQKVDAEGKPIEGQTEIEKRILVVNLGYKNFFSILEGFGAHFGTVTDRDYFVKRKGDDQSTTYSIIPNDPIDVEGQRLDKNHPKWATRYASNIDLGQVVADRASDDWYARWFDVTKPYPTSGGGSSSGDSSTDDDSGPAAPSAEVDDEKLADLRSRVRGFGQADAPSEPQPAAAGASGGMADFG